MFTTLATLASRVTPIARTVAPHIIPVGIVAVREFAIGVSIGAGIRTAGDGIVRSVERDAKNEPFLDPNRSASENIGELTGTYAANVVKETRTYGPFWGGMALSTALLPVAPTVSAWMYVGGVSWLMRPIFKKLVSGFLDGWNESKPLDLSKPKKVTWRQRRAASATRKAQAAKTATSTSTVMGAIPDHIQDDTVDPQTQKVSVTLDLAAIQHNPFTAGVSVAFQMCSGHPERINPTREALLTAMRENTVVTDSQAKSVLAGFNSQAKLLRRAA